MSDLNDKEKLFRTQIGQAATVQRKQVGAEMAAIPNRKLADLGLSINPLPDNLDYRGSAAVHVYWNATLQQVFFISQTQPLDLYRCPEPLAQKAFDDLLKQLKTMYGHRPGRLRSGF